MRITSQSVKDTLKIGKIIAKGLKQGDIICLFGQLGSGKTVLTKGIASGLGIKNSDVISPTFVLIRQHKKSKLPLNHFDLYRLKNQKEAVDLGYEEYFFGDGVTVIEWADRLKYLLPREYLKIKLSVAGESKRDFEINAVGLRYKKLLNSLKKKL